MLYTCTALNASETQNLMSICELKVYFLDQLCNTYSVSYSIFLYLSLDLREHMLNATLFVYFNEWSPVTD